MSGGFVYCMRPCAMRGPIKIGFSNAPTDRIKAISEWSPFPLEIAAMIAGNRPLEYRLHRRFWDSHSHREWFHPTPDVLGCVTALQNGYHLNDAVDFSMSVLSATPKWQRPRVMDQAERRYVSYRTRLFAAMRKIQDQNALRKSLFAPPKASDLVAVSRERLLTSMEDAYFNNVVTNIHSHAVTWDALYPELVPCVEKATGVDCTELRPDLWDAEATR